MVTSLFLAIAVQMSGADASSLSPDACALRIYSDSTFVGTAIYCSGHDNTSTYIATAYHNVYKSKKVELSFSKENDLLEPITSYIDGGFVCYPEADLAVFRCTKAGVKLLEKTYGRTPVELFGGVVKPGDQVAIAGNASMTWLKGTKRESVVRPLYWVDGGTVAHLTTFSKLNLDVAKGQASKTDLLFLSSKEVTYGYSGGPVLVKGKLAGMIQGGDPESQHRCWAIPSKYIVDAQKMSSTSFPPKASDWRDMLFDMDKVKFGLGSLEIMRSEVARSSFNQDRLKNLPVKWNMESEANLSTDGVLSLKATTKIDVPVDETESYPDQMLEFTGKTTILLFSSDGRLIWQSNRLLDAPVAVGGKAVGRESRTDVMNYKVPKEIMGGVDCMFVVNWCESRYDGYSLHFDLKEREAKDNVRPPNGKGLILNPDIEKGRFHIQYSKELRNFLQDHPAKANIK